MAVKIGMKPPHPGGFIRRSVLPDELSVTAAAEVLGVGRPALSNLLNEKASLSPEMALRIEKAFGVKMDAACEEVEPVLAKMHEAGKGVIGMKLIGEGTFRDSDEKRNKSISYVLGLGTVDAMVVGFEHLDEIDDFAARVRQVPRIQYSV